MKKWLLPALPIISFSLFAGNITRFDLDFSKGYSAQISTGQASFLRGNAAISDGAMLVKSGFASGAAGTPIPYNPLIYSAKDNLPQFVSGTITADICYRQLPEKSNYLSPVWTIRRVKNTKVTGFCRMQIKFAAGKVSLEYDEFNLDSPKAKTLRISIPITGFTCGKNYRIILNINGRERNVKIAGSPEKTVRTPWDFPEFMQGANSIVVGGAYENSGRLVDPQVELLIRRLVIREFINTERSEK